MEEMWRSSPLKPNDLSFNEADWRPTVIELSNRESDLNSY